MSEHRLLKQLAVKKAIEQIRNGYIVGLGSGSTIEEGLKEIARVLKERNIDATFIPTSYQIELAAIRNGLRLGLFTEYPEPDVAIDGADEVDKNLDLIKGGGGALLREKIVDSAAKKLLILVDEWKIVKELGEKQPVPLEVLPFAHQAVIRRISRLEGRPMLREGKGKLGPIVTDNGNFIVDADFGPIHNPRELEARLRSIPGVIETGLFIGLAHSVYVARGNGSVQILERQSS